MIGPNSVEWAPARRFRSKGQLAVLPLPLTHRPKFGSSPGGARTRGPFSPGLQTSSELLSTNKSARDRAGGRRPMDYACGGQPIG
jgi:hypothetical protein